jgi:hypothetical protein
MTIIFYGVENKSLTSSRNILLPTIGLALIPQYLEILTAVK